MLYCRDKTIKANCISILNQIQKLERGKREKTVWSWDRLAVVDHLWISDAAAPNTAARDQLDGMRSL